MLKLTNNIKKLILSAQPLSQNYTILQTVRWKRKPLYLGTAKSKIFRVPPRQVLPEDEAEEVKRLFNNYRTHMKSIRRYLTHKYALKYQTSSDPEEMRKVFEEDFVRCSEINNKWNTEQKVLREKRVAEELEAHLEFARKRIKSEDDKKQAQLKQIEELVKKEKELSKTYITPENIDAAIEHALANPVDYNFAVDLEGNKIHGRDTKVEQHSIKAEAQ